MTLRQKYRIMIWAVSILVVTNLSMGLSFWYHKYQEKQIIDDQNSARYELPAHQRTRFFREQLNLNQEQVGQFRDLNRKFNQNAHDIQNQLSVLRMEMMYELDSNSNREILDSISTQIGLLHKALKDETIVFYMGMKNISDEEQQKTLYKIFISVLESDEEVQLPQRGRGYGLNRRSK